MASISESVRLRLEQYEAKKIRQAERAERGRLRREERAAATARYVVKRAMWAEQRAAREVLQPRRPREPRNSLNFGRMPWPDDYLEFRAPMMGCALSRD